MRKVEVGQYWSDDTNTLVILSVELDGFYYRLNGSSSFYRGEILPMGWKLVKSKPTKRNLPSWF